MKNWTLVFLPVLLSVPGAVGAQETASILVAAAQRTIALFPARTALYVDQWAPPPLSQYYYSEATRHDRSVLTEVAQSINARIGSRDLAAKCFRKSTPGCLPDGDNGLVTLSLPVVRGDTAHVSARLRSRSGIRTARFPAGRSASADYILVLVRVDGAWKVVGQTITRSS